MSTLPAISLHAPWGTAIAHGLKRWETRSWPCPPRYIGQTIAIHQAKRRPDLAGTFGDWSICKTDGYAGSLYFLVSPSECAELALGAIVATARIVACVSCVVRDAEQTGISRNVNGLWYLRPGDHPSEADNITDQEPWGDFTPGRWAWQLDQIQPLAVPVPVRSPDRKDYENAIRAAGGSTYVEYRAGRAHITLRTPEASREQIETEDLDEAVQAALASFCARAGLTVTARPLRTVAGYQVPA